MERDRGKGEMGTERHRKHIIGGGRDSWFQQCAGKHAFFSIQYNILLGADAPPSRLLRGGCLSPPPPPASGAYGTDAGSQEWKDTQQDGGRTMIRGTSEV